MALDHVFDDVKVWVREAVAAFASHVPKGRRAGETIEDGYEGINKAP